MYVRRKSCVLSETAFIEKRLLVRFNKLSSSNSLPQLDYTIKSRQIYGLSLVFQKLGIIMELIGLRGNLSLMTKRKKKSLLFMYRPGAVSVLGCFVGYRCSSLGAWAKTYVVGELY